MAQLPIATRWANGPGLCREARHAWALSTRAQIDSPIRDVRTDLGIVAQAGITGALEYYRSAGEMTLGFLLRLARPRAAMKVEHAKVQIIVTVKDSTPRESSRLRVLTVVAIALPRDLKARLGLNTSGAETGVISSE